MSEPRWIYLVSEADDWIEAAFTDEKDAQALLRKKVAGRDEQEHHWWLQRIPLDPEQTTGKESE